MTALSALGTCWLWTVLLGCWKSAGDCLQLQRLFKRNNFFAWNFNAIRFKQGDWLDVVRIWLVHFTYALFATALLPSPPPISLFFLFVPIQGELFDCLANIWNCIIFSSPQNVYLVSCNYLFLIYHAAHHAHSRCRNYSMQVSKFAYEFNWAIVIGLFLSFSLASLSRVIVFKTFYFYSRIIPYSYSRIIPSFIPFGVAIKIKRWIYTCATIYILNVSLFLMINFILLVIYLQ